MDIDSYPHLYVKYFGLRNLISCQSDNMVTCCFYFTTTDLYTPLPPIYWHIQGNSETGGKQKEDDLLSGDFVTVVRQDYFV